MKTNLMKIFSFFFLLATMHITHAAPKTKVIWIEDDSEFSSSEKSSNTRELKRRVRQLEKAVAQLQRRVFELEYKDNTGTETTEKPKKFTCYIETTFEGLISETRESITEAKAAVVKACSAKTDNSLNCKIDKVKCGE